MTMMAHVTAEKALKGHMGYHAGRSAEGQIAMDYERRGLPVTEHRWRGVGGEIDLIARDGDGLIFIEVKKSRSFARAAQRLSKRQMERLYASASEYMANEPKGELTEARFDVALVDAAGRFEIIENALHAA